MAVSDQKVFSRFDPGARGDPESSREGREDFIESTLQGPQQGVEPGWQSCPTALQHQRSQIFSQAELAEAPQRFRRKLAEAIASLQGSAEGIWRSDAESAAGIDFSEEASTELEQTSSSFRDANDYGGRGCAIRAYGPGSKRCLRSRSSGTCSSSSRKSPAEHRSCCQGERCHGDSIRRRRGQKVQTSTIHGALWRPRNWIARWTAQLITQIVILGSDVTCLRNAHRVPVPHIEATENVEAYRLPCGYDAACIPDLIDNSLQLMIRCHSIHWDPSFLSEPAALGEAMILRSEVLSEVDPLLPRCKHGKAQSCTLPSALKCTNRKDQNAKNVRFQPFVNVFEEYYPPLTVPLCNDCNVPDEVDIGDISSLMARQPRPQEPSESPIDDTDSDFETHEPSSPSSFPGDARWRSVQVYDLRSNYGRGRIQVWPPEATFAEARRILGYTHHEVAEIFDIVPPPADLDAVHVQPLLLVLHDDVLFGDNRRAVLIDVQLHGPHFDSAVEIDRYTIMLPSPIHRTALLRIAGVAQYCRVGLDRCLLWHRGNLIPAQATYMLDLAHGDYIKIAVPPFRTESVPTYFAVRACQQGLNADEVEIRHQFNPNADELFTDVEAAQQQNDEQAHLQLSSSTNVVPINKFRCSEHHIVPTPELTCMMPETFLPHRQQPAHDPPRQSWFNALQSAFAERAETACEEEGPIAFVETWYLQGSVVQKTEESRTLQLDQHTQLWYQDLIQLWRDRIDFMAAVDCYYVQPEPPRHETSWNIGHLIISQRVAPPFSAVLLTLRFLTDRRTGLNYVAAVMRTPTNAYSIRDLCNVARVCVDRQFEIQRGPQRYPPGEDVQVQNGDGLIFNIHPPVITHHVGDDQVVTPQWIPVSAGPELDPDVDLILAPDITEQTEFTQELFEHWDVHARVGPANIERLLHVTTWCLNADRTRFNDETRVVTLGDDFHAWESQLQRAWQDLLDPNELVHFAIVDDQPAGFAGGYGLHIIVHQHLCNVERATIVTVFNDFLRSAPHIAAVILPHLVGSTALIQAVHREDECPPRNPYTVCNTWQVGWQFNDIAPYRCQHGQTFMLIIQPHFQGYWDDEEIDVSDAQASSSMNLLQHRVQLSRALNEGNEEHPAHDRRQTTGTVAQAQWPDRTMICLDELIRPSPTICVDFSSVFRLADEIKSTSFMFEQQWPVDLPVPEVTQHALDALLPCADAIPEAFHFFTDGSKAPTGRIGSAAILLVQTKRGWHYGGCLYKTINAGTTSIAGENGAIIWALLWAIGISDEMWLRHGRSDIFFTFNFDATSAGFVAAGYWKSTLDPCWRTTMRSLAQLLTIRHGIDHLAWNYVQAHVGHPWNEGADALAKYAALHNQGSDESHCWENWLTNEDKQTALQWLWYLEMMVAADPRTPMLYNEQMVCVCPTENLQPPTALQEASPTQHVASPQHAAAEHMLDLTIATANVLTMATDAKRTSSISRQYVLMEQFEKANCIIVGLQETRHQHITGASNEHYHIYSHKATPAGQDGVQLWISKKIPVWQNGPVISPKDVRIVDSAPNFIVAKIKIHLWRCIVITGRAPHSGRPPDEIHAFWNHLTRVLQRKSARLPIIFCGDANAHLGEFVTKAVGPLHPNKENIAGKIFHNWLLHHNLFVPSTFPDHHVGQEHNTFVAPDGDTETRIDYIALPHAIAYNCIEASVELNVDIGVQRQDHKVALCRFGFEALSVRPEAKRKRQYKPDVTDIQQKLQHHDWLSQLHYATVTPPWSLNPHSSAEWLAASTMSAMQMIAKPKQQWKRKSHVSQSTWQLVDQKKFLYKQLRALKRAELFTLLQACFRGWFFATRQDSLLPLPFQAYQHIVQDLPAWLRLHDLSTAQTLTAYHQVARQVHQAIKEEDASFYSALAEKAATTYHVEGLQNIWRQIRALLPKNRAKQNHQSRDIDDELLKHFEQLEAGNSKPFAALQQECVWRSIQEQDDGLDCLHLQLHELPTLAEIEHLCLAQKPKKATGPDGIPSDLCRYGAVAIAPQLQSLICKSFLLGREPVTFKGGILCPIFKGKSHVDDASGYRGIILADSYAKITHAWARKRLLPTLQDRKTIGQLGGLPAQQTITGVQIVRMHSIVGQSKGISTATLFIDLKSAFHHMLRELIFAMHNHLSVDLLAQMLDEQDFDLERLCSQLDELCSTSITDMPPGLRRFLHDIHQHTWFCLRGHQQEYASCTHTMRGTRPGSPLADIGFNLLMTDFLKELQAALMDDEDFIAGTSALGTCVPPIAWMDDIAISLATVVPNRLIPLVERTIAAAHTAFRARGLTMNLEPGKTELVVMFRGEGAVQCRSEMFNRDKAPQVTVATDSHVITVRVAASYRHLGVRFAMNLDFDAEINARLGAARQAYEQLKKAVFQNAAIPVHCRVSLFQSLVLSRLLYGCAIWAEISSASYKKLEAMVIDSYRKIYGTGFWSEDRVTDKDFLQGQELMSFRLHLARHRLCYLQNVSKYGITAHKTLLLAEFATGKGWLREVAQDLQWLGAFKDLPFDTPETRPQWLQVWHILRDCPQWKSWIKRAVRKHIVQEKIAFDIRSYHRNIVAELKHFGMRLADEEDQPLQVECIYRCNHCTAAFSTGQQLALHAFRIHGHRARECQYVQSEVCPGCLKTFHTSFRVSQHLRYRPNKCWERIYGVRAPGVPANIGLPKHLCGVHRLPAVRRHHGPLRPTAHQRERLRVRQAISQLREEGQNDFAWWDPSTDKQLLCMCTRRFEACLDEWLQMEQQTEEHFHNLFFNLFQDLGVPEFQAARIFIHWIETEFYSFCAKIEDVDVLEVLEQAHLSLLEDIHIWNLQRQMRMLQKQWEWLQMDEPRQKKLLVSAPLPRKPRAWPIIMDYNAMAEDEQKRRSWRMRERPKHDLTPVQGPFFIIHLYAGRRRNDDFHAQMQHLVDNEPLTCSPVVTVISIDTAIHDSMDVHSTRIWSFLLAAARAGRILALLLGPPCETWSNARFAQLVDQDGNIMRGPRPLRSAQICWGLPGLSLAELEQVAVGNCLLLRGLWLCIPVALSGGSVILEHPAPPYQMERPAVWRTSIFLLLLRDGWLFRRHTFAQGRHGAVGRKPTTLLHAQCPIIEVLEENAMALDQMQLQPLIGRDAQGGFKTAVAKEHPSNLCRCFAVAFWRQISKRALNPMAGPIESVAFELGHQSCRVDPARLMRADYQPMR